MSEIRNVTVAELRTIVTDPAELQKGTEILDKGGLSHLARHGMKLFAEATGSGAAPYKPQIVFDDKDIRGRCSCMAARSRPFCKHAAALLLAWARDANGFVVAEAPAVPEGAADGAAKKARLKTAKVDAGALMRSGVDQVLELVRELAVAGVSAIAAERAAQVRALAETLRAERLRRLSARTLELAALLDVAAKDYGAFDAAAYAGTLGDMLLAARRIGKHLDGDTLKPEYVEELIGRTWTKKDREPLAGLDLVEYAFRNSVTPDDFVIRESRFIDLASGTHYSEKQIVPAFMAKRGTKPSYDGLLLSGAAGSRYPGFAPVRLEVADAGQLVEWDQGTLERVAAHAKSGVADALAALQELRKDPFAPDLAPVALCCSTLLAEAGRLFAIDAAGNALALPKDPATELLLTGALAEAELVAVFGDITFDGALPTLFPLAVMLRKQGGLSMLPVAAGDAGELLQRRRAGASGAAPRRERWLERARELGVGAGAVILGEIREELADTLAQGLGALDARRAQPWIERLGELSLAKPAALLGEIAGRSDPAEKLDDTIKLHQVFGIGLAKLAAARVVARESLTASPLHPAVHVQAPERDWTIEELPGRLHAPGLDRHQRAVVVSRTLAAAGAHDLARLAPVLWADGSVTPMIAEAYSRHPTLALELARQTLKARYRHRNYSMESRWAAAARVSKLAAIRVLAKLDGAAARQLLEDACGDSALDPSLRAMARQCAGGRPAPVAAALLEPLHAANRETRIEGLRRLGEQGALRALPAVRQLAANDPSREVRYAAWAVQALLLDLDAVDLLVERLRARAQDETAAREAAFALGLLGDARSIASLLDAFEEGWRATTISDSLCTIGPSVLVPLLERIEARGELAGRASAQQVVTTLDATATLAVMLERIPAALDEAALERAALYAKLAKGLPPLLAGLACAIEDRAQSLDPKGRAAKAAAKLVAKARETERPAARPS